VNGWDGWMGEWMVVGGKEGKIDGRVDEWADGVKER
jgi:hypothetical protein